MALYRKISPRIWNDEKFIEMSATAQLAMLFMLTHPNMTAVGAMRTTLQGLSFEHDKIPLKAFQEVFTQGFAKADSKAPVLWFPNFIKYNQPENPNVVRAWVKAFDLIPECETKNLIIQSVKDFLKGFSEGFQKAFTKELPKELPETGAGAGAGAGYTNTENCPIQKIIDLYHTNLPDLPEIKDLTQIKSKISARWHDDKKRQSLEWWETFFDEDIKQSDFLMGKVKEFKANLDWISGPKNFSKILNGTYRNKNKFMRKSMVAY